MTPKVPLEFLVFSDLHLHEWSFGAHHNATLPGNEYVPTLTGLNSRLVDGAKCIKQVIDYAHENDIYHILFAGDLLHKKKNITKDEISVLSNTFTMYAGWDRKFHMIPGNHDYADREGHSHSLLALQRVSGINLFNNPMTWYSGYANSEPSLAITAIPYSESKEKTLWEINNAGGDNDADYRILMLHAGINGARVGSDYVMTKSHDIAMKEIDTSRYDIVLWGHFHSHQQLGKNSWVVGATNQHNWGDAGDPRGFLHVRIDPDKKITIKQVPTDTSVPRFHVVSQGDDITHIRPHDFVKYVLAEPLTEELKDKIEGLFLLMNGGLPCSLELIPPPTERSEASLSKKAISADTALDDWISNSNTELNKELLLKIGKELLREAKNEV